MMKKQAAVQRLKTKSILYISPRPRLDACMYMQSNRGHIYIYIHIDIIYNNYYNYIRPHASMFETEVIFLIFHELLAILYHLLRFFPDIYTFPSSLHTRVCTL